MIKKQVLRILDVNFNRSREGLRVCEEISRFVLEDKPLSQALKKERHAITRLLNQMPVSFESLLSVRNSREDIGRAFDPLEKDRRSIYAIFWANAERTKESLRVLEEFSKLVHQESSRGFKKIRFQIYDVEKRAMPKLASLRDHRSNHMGPKVC